MNIYEDGLEGEEYDGLQHFQLNIIILEAKHLSMINSDTKVVVSVGKRNKILRSKTTKTDAPYFNELCIFNFYLPLSVLLDEILKIKLYGVPKLKRNRLVGSFSVELATVWSQPNHQFYHKWAALTDPQNPAGGVKGYLKCDIALLSQGTKSKQMDRDPGENIENHMLVPFGEINDRQKAKFVFSLFRADNFSNFFSSDPLRTFYAYVRITYAGLSATTTVVSGTFNPSWNQELAFVDMIPALCQYVHIEICDALKTTSRGILGSANLDLRKLSHENENGFLPTYGPTFLYLYQNFAKLDKHNKCAFVSSSFTYMCRLLMALRTEVVDYAEDVLAKQKNMLAIKPKRIPPLEESKYFKYSEFIFFAAIFDVLLFDTSIVTNRVSFRVNIGPGKPAINDDIFISTINIKPSLKKTSDDDEDDKSSVRTKKTVTFEDERSKKSEISINDIKGDKQGPASDNNDKQTSDESSGTYKLKLRGWKQKGKAFLSKEKEHLRTIRRHGEHGSPKFGQRKIYNDTRNWKPLRQLRYWPNEFPGKRKRSESDTEEVPEEKPFERMKLEGLMKNFKPFPKFNSFKKSNHREGKKDGTSLGEGDSSKKLDSGTEEHIGKSRSSGVRVVAPVLVKFCSNDQRYSETLILEREMPSTEEIRQEKEKFHFSEHLLSPKEWHLKKTLKEKLKERRARKEGSSLTPSESSTHEKENGTDGANTFPKRFLNKIETVASKWGEKRKESNQSERESDTESKMERLRKKIKWKRANTQKYKAKIRNVNILGSWTPDCKPKEISEAELSSESGKDSLINRKKKLFKKWSEEWKRKRRERLEEASSASGTTEKFRSKFREWRKHQTGIDWRAIKSKGSDSDTDGTKQRRFDRIKKAATSPRDWKILKKRKYLRYWPTDWKTVKKAFPPRAEGKKRKSLRKFGLIHLRKECFKKPVTKTEEKDFSSSTEENTESLSVPQMEEEPESITISSSYMDDTFFEEGNCPEKSGSQEEMWSEKTVWQEPLKNEDLSYDSLLDRGEKEWQRIKNVNTDSTDFSGEFYGISDADSKQRFKTTYDGERGGIRSIKNYEEQSSSLDESDTSTDSSYEPRLKDQKKSEHSSSSPGKKRVQFVGELKEVGSISESETLSSSSTEFLGGSIKEEKNLKRKEINYMDNPQSETDESSHRSHYNHIFSPQNTTEKNLQIYFALKQKFPEVIFPPETNILAYYAKIETSNKFNFFKKKCKPEQVLQPLLSETEDDKKGKEYGEGFNNRPQKKRIWLANKRTSGMKMELIHEQKEMKDNEESNDEHTSEKYLEKERKKPGMGKEIFLAESNKKHNILTYYVAEEFPDLDKNNKIRSGFSERKTQKGLPKSEEMNIIEITANNETEDDFQTEGLQVNSTNEKRVMLERNSNSSQLKRGSVFNGKREAIEDSEESFSEREENEFGLNKEKASEWEEPIKKSKDGKIPPEFPTEVTNVENFDKSEKEKKSPSKESLEEDEKEFDMEHKLRDWSMTTLKESFREKNKLKNKLMRQKFPKENKHDGELYDLFEDDIRQLKGADDRIPNKDKKKGPEPKERLIEYKDDEIKDLKKQSLLRKPRQPSVIKMDQTLDPMEQNLPGQNEPQLVSANEIKHVKIYNGCNTTASKPITVRQNYGFANFSGSYPCVHLNGEWPNALRKLYRSNIVQKSVINFKNGLAEVESDLTSENRMEASEKLKKIYNTLSEDCQNILSLTNKIEPEDTNLYRERRRYYHSELKEIMQKAESASKKKVLIAEDELKRAYTYLTTLVRFAQDPEDSFPDTEIWLVKDGNSVAQHRMKTQKIVFSPNMNERGTHSGKIQSIIARGREGQEVAKIDIFMWFGLGSHFAECKKLLPRGFRSEPHKCPGTIVWDVPLHLSYTEEHYFQCCIHLFQARILVGADVTGLADPFVRATVLNQFKESQIQKETLNPTWDETLIFSKLMIHGPADYIKDNSITITVEVIDYDFMSKNELIGRTLLKPVVWLHDEEYKPPKLAWEEIRKECSETGKILLAAEMWEVSKDDPEEPRKQEKVPIPESVRPISVGHRLEVLFWGVRELRRKSQRTMKVFVTLECGGKYLTSPILKNANKHLNFPGTVQTLDLELPEEHEYKPPLIIKLFQTGAFVLGRETYSGNCIIPSVKAFFSAAMDDLEKKKNEISFKELLAEAKKVKKAEEEEALVLEKAQRKKKRWKRLKTKIMTILESLAAFFVKIFKRIKCKIKKSCADIDRSTIAYDEDETLDWWVKYYASREHREDSPDTETLVIYEEELEAQPEFRGFSDFIYTFDLVTGKGRKSFGNQISAGKVKAAIKLYRWPLQDGSYQTLCGVDIRKGVLKQLPSNASIKYVVRVYIVSCRNLTPKDLNGKSDPYLILQIGKQRINEEKNYVPKQVNPIFGKCFEFKGTFPKEHLLRIKVMDHDIFSEDDLIGETLVDLESRYYTKHHASCGLPKTYSRTGYTAWRDAYRPSEILKMVCKQSNMMSPVYTENSVRIGEYEFQGVVTNKKHQMEMHALAALKKWHEIPLHGFHLVPEHVETRALYHPSFPGVEQGKIEMWIDIFPADFRYVPPIVDIEPRKPVAMELRAIVWNVEGVILNDTTLFFNEKMSDIYVQGWLNALEDDKQVTDVHYRSMNGEGNFNWRFIFPFKYIASERRLVVLKKQTIFDTEPEEMKFPCKLELQVWDNDFFSDDFLGSLNLELCSMPRGAKISTTCKLSMFEENTPKINLFKIRRTRGWWPFRRIVDAESSEYSLTGKIDLELEVMTEKEAQDNPVGKARDEPKALPEPKRPESSFVWFLNPLKTFKYIICKKYGKTLIMLLLIAMLITFLLLGIYSFPGYTVKKILGA